MDERSFLLVDDESAIRDLNARYLRDIEPSLIDEAENGAVAIDKIKRKPYRLVFMDLKMPQIDGFTAVHRIKEQRPEQSILVLTSTNLDRDVLELLRYPCVDLLKKPYNRSQFLNKVREILNSTNFDSIPTSTYRHPVELVGKINGVQTEIISLGVNSAIVRGDSQEKHLTLEIRFPKRLSPVIIDTIVQPYDSQHLLLFFINLTSSTEQFIERFVLESLENSRGTL